MFDKKKIRLANSHLWFDRIPKYPNKTPPELHKEFQQKYSDIFVSNGLTGLQAYEEELMNRYEIVASIIKNKEAHSDIEYEKACNIALFIDDELALLSMAIAEATNEQAVSLPFKPHQEEIYKEFKKLSSQYGVSLAFDKLKERLIKRGLNPREFNLKDDAYSFNRACNKYLNKPSS